MHTKTLGLLAALGLALGCSSAKEEMSPAKTRPFFWSTATAAYQVEGDLHGTDWHQWEYQPDGGEWPDGGGHIAGNDHADKGPDQLHRYEADFDLAKQAGSNAMRLSIEWARIEPTEGRYDPEAIAHYHRVLKALRDRGLTPMVTLQHFTFPTWIHDVNDGSRGYGGWAGRDGDGSGQGGVVSRFARFSGDMAKEFGAEVDDWITINEPFVLVAATYVNPTPERFPAAPYPSDLVPPMEGVNLGLGVRAAVNMVHAHARAYDAIHAQDTVDADGDGKAALVSIAHHMRVFVPAGGDVAAAKAARQLDYVNNDLILNAIVRGDLDINLDGAFDGPGEGQGIAALKGRADFIGLNYYSVSKVLPFTVKNAAGVSIAGLPLEDDGAAYPHSDLGWRIYPEGIHDLVARVWGTYGLPIFITENGVADSADVMRSKFLVDHVEQLMKAKSEGAQVLGYTHWSLIDNFEWAKGLAPRFGLFTVDYATQKRTPTKAVEAFKAISQAGGVTPDIRARFGK